MKRDDIRKIFEGFKDVNVEAGKTNRPNTSHARFAAERR